VCVQIQYEPHPSQARQKKIAGNEVHPEKKTQSEKPPYVKRTQLNAAVCTLEDTIAVCSRPTTWRAYSLVYVSRGRGILLSIFYMANLDSGTAVLGKISGPNAEL
jgi:hypothetical protein